MGRPLGSENKDKPFREAIRMEMILACEGKKCTAKKGSIRWIARRLLERAGDETTAAKEIGDRLDGKPMQAIETSGPEGGPIYVISDKPMTEAEWETTRTGSIED
jgi:hypothetical protein